MELDKKNYPVSEKLRRNSSSVDEELEEVDFSEKRHQNWTYQILKYNPIDPLNDLWRYIIKRLDLEDIEGKLQWWAAYYFREISS